MELTINDLSKEYGRKKALNHFSAKLTNGVYGLLGANGAGKTTLMRIICDVQTETKGAIFFNGKNIHDLGEKYRNILGYLPQNFLPPAISVSKHVVATRKPLLHAAV